METRLPVDGDSETLSLCEHFWADELYWPHVGQVSCLLGEE